PGQRGYTLVLRPLAQPVPADPGAMDRRMLDERKVDLLIVVPPDFQKRLSRGKRPAGYPNGPDRDETSKLVGAPVAAVLQRWERNLKQVRLASRGLPIDFDEPLDIRDPSTAKKAGGGQEGLLAMVVRIFPFVLVMWSLAGALYPAVDLCAGEKERGTMGTLLISPASREEIVWGKFLAIWVFSGATALLNLLSMALTTWQFSSVLEGASFQAMALVWGVLLLLPLSAFFSALCLAVGAYARSS